MIYEKKCKTKESFIKEEDKIGCQATWSKKCLTYMHNSCIYMHMRTTINIDSKLIEKASKLTGIKEKTALVRRGLEALISVESSKRLAQLGGTEKSLRPIPRRRFK